MDETLVEFVDRHTNIGTGWEDLAEWLYREERANEVLVAALKEIAGHAQATAEIGGIARAGLKKARE